jgi:hypothetical protein
MKTLLPTYLRLGPRPLLSCARQFEASGLDRKHWSSAGPIRTIFKDAFAAAGVERLGSFVPASNPCRISST